MARPSQFANQFEAEKYDEAVSKFAVYNDVKKIFEHLNEFTLEIKELFKVVEANNTSSNFFSRGEVDEVKLKIRRPPQKTSVKPLPNIILC